MNANQEARLRAEAAALRRQATELERVVVTGDVSGVLAVSNATGEIDHRLYLIWDEVTEAEFDRQDARYRETKGSGHATR